MNEYRVEIRPGVNGTIDEVLVWDKDGGVVFHLEQMDNDHYWFVIYATGYDDGYHFNMRARKKKLLLTRP